jgi:hypothetical protein
LIGACSLQANQNPKEVNKDEVHRY